MAAGGPGDGRWRHGARGDHSDPSTSEISQSTWEIPVHMVTLSRSFEPDINTLGSSITERLGNISQNWWPQHTVGTAASFLPLAIP